MEAMRGWAGWARRVGRAAAAAVAMAASGHAAATPPSGLRCDGTPTLQAIPLRWDAAPRSPQTDRPAWTFRLWVNGAGVVERTLDASSYVLRPAHFRGGRIPGDAVNLEVGLQKVGADGRASATSRLRVYVQDKRARPSSCRKA